MRRHLITGIFGNQDDVLIRAARDEHRTVLQLITGDNSLNFHIQDIINELRRLNVLPSEIGADLIILATHIYAADTRISRATESQDGWTREIRLVVPVSDITRWNTCIRLLERMLNFLTGDRWAIGFRPRPPEHNRLIDLGVQQLIPPPFTNVNLFSGGLDSLIGAIDDLEQNNIPLFVSHAGDGATSAAQDNCYNGLRNEYQGDFNRLRFWLNISGNTFDDVEADDTTRVRSFLFFSLGVLAGTGIQQPFRLHVPENGLIALNVPLDDLRLGSLSTRTTHPFYMDCWNQLIQTLGIQGSVVNPYWNCTKGEMVNQCQNQRLLRRLIPISMSCSSPTKGRWHGRSTEHCGYCLPCIIRRASIPRDRTTYTIPNLQANPLSTFSSEGKQIRSFQIALRRLERNANFARLLIHKPGPIPDRGQLAELEDVYLRGMREVGRLLNKVVTVSE